MSDLPSSGLGGFIGLEDPMLPDGARRDEPWPGGGVPFVTGREALRTILETVRPRLIMVPGWICDVVLEPIRVTSTPWLRYPASLELDHAHAPEPADDELLLVVDHFGLQTREMHGLAERFGPRLVVDATQALFAVPPAESWSFTSLRKFLGVSDGATLLGPRAVTAPTSTFAGDERHLELRAAGRLDDAREAFLAHEAELGTLRGGPSDAARRRLERIDVDRVVARRRANFLTLHERLGAHNRLRCELPDGGAPHAYPFLSERAVDVGLLHRQRLFVPTFWPEMPSGIGTGDHGGVDPVAAELAARLLPLPIDQRYDTGEMELVAAAVLELVTR